MGATVGRDIGLPEGAQGGQEGGLGSGRNLRESIPKYPSMIP